ncbi:MAG: carotenoid biosynthesis protein [Ferruginibacter sp.]
MIERYMLKSRTQIATALAIFFHMIGLVGMFFNKEFFLAATPFNLLLMFLLLLYTQRTINIPFVVLMVVCFVTGISVEIIGTSTGYLFGEYAYGSALGPTIKNVPWVIGINWITIIYCSGVAVHMLLERLSAKLETVTGAPSPAIRYFSVISDGAMLAVFFDWIMEPAAIKLGYWQWLGDGEIPAYNYLCWFIISMGLMGVFTFLKFEKKNIFAVNLLLIMMMFFMLIRTFL